ncbi:MULTISPECIES: helix-turn-helix domain-containing protein [Rummeliibacillus]|uniref:helix-turn-helix domain-containing protein n=1 Tax=Rummeliibacillus TaxID=648802 RepID=UPI0011B7D501|nr:MULTISPECIES: helix-turn-helix domain-containing protein [Rummeliibacillus]MBO2536281.1 helix-turn-helix domain-containing protein [Rummeliibacillus suwonensis]
MAKTLYQLAIDSKNDTEAVEKILKAFKPKIKKSLQQTKFQNRVDIEQELELKLISIIKMYEVDELDGFWRFYERQNHYKESYKVVK